MASRFAALVILLGASASAPASAAAAETDEAQLLGLEQAYAGALVTRDVEFLKNYYAPDWRGGDWMGFASKTNILNLLKSGRYTIKSMTLRDVRVRLLGDVAIVQGSDDEITSMHGKDTSGSWGWTDIFQKRGGRWVCIASQTTKLTRAAR